MKLFEHAICSFRLGMLATLLLWTFASSQIGHAQVTTAISPTLGTGNLNTRINSSTGLCTANCVITGGTRTGTNLYHSFGQFGVGPGDVANFFNETGLPTSNILGRVTGGSISNIYGSIITTNFPGANLFLMNPNGFLFGPNASVNVAGMATFTTADYMRMVDGGRFNARLDAISSDVLTSTPVAAFGFLGSNPAAITFEGGQLTVTGGAGLKIVGGDINLTSDASGMPSSITAPGRTVQLTSVAGPGEVAADSTLPASGMSLGSITFTDGSIISTAGDLSFGDGSGGAVSIRGGQIVASGTQILTGPAIGSAGQGGAVAISSTNDAAFTNFTTIDTSSFFSGGNAGAISINALNVNLEDSFVLARAESDGSTSGAGGDITLTGTNSVNLTRSFLVADTFSSNGNGGAVSITAPTVALQDSGMFTGTFGGGSGGAVTLTGTSSVSLINSGLDTFTQFTTGNSGSVTITGSTITISNVGGSGASIDTSTHSFDFPTAGNGGAITITGTQISFTDSARIQSVADSSGSFSKGGTILVSGSENILVDNGTLFLTTSTSQGGAGNIELAAKHVTLTGTSTLSSETLGPGGGGTIKITGTENIALASGSLISTNSANSGGALQGPAGQIELITPQLMISDGSQIRSQTFGTGLGGTVTAQGLSGPGQSILIDGTGTGIFTDTNSFIQDGKVVGVGQGGSIFLNATYVAIQNGATISANTSGRGNAGNILVKAGTLNIESGGQITSSSSFRQTPFFSGEVIPPPTGNAGTVTIEGVASPANSILIDGSGSGVFTNTQGTGKGGNINLSANSVTLQNGANSAQVSSTSTGSGIAGDVTITAGNQFTMTSSKVTSQADHSSGGTIKITTNPDGTVQLTDSTISTSVLNGNGGGGSVNIDPQYVILQNSHITANAVEGPGGNIFITTNLLLPDANSTITASSQFGQQGTVTIQSPASPASGKINPLGQKPLIAASLVSQRCAALAGGNYSSFTVAGRDSLPAEPGEWVSTPLALAALGDNTGQGDANQLDQTNEISLLSLRKIAPSGFLTQTFAANSTEGCGS